MVSTIHPVILCGGSGTRLWPLSKPEMPKQFLALTSDQSMIEETVARFSFGETEALSFGDPLVVGSIRHSRLLAEKLPTARKILEPFGRNSAPAVAAACLAYNPDDLILILPADHDIRDVPSFHNAIKTAADAAVSGAIVTFGIEPTHPATGYGYIKAAGSVVANSSMPVEQFVEKPALELAKSYLADGSYFWNAGIFLFKASVMLEALETFAPDVLAGTRAAMPDSSAKKIHLERHAFAKVPSISIDYAVMENAPNVETVPVNMGWSDVGGYDALHELLTTKSDENHSQGPVILRNTKGSYIRSEGPVVTVNGVSDLVIIATNTEVMVTPLNQSGAAKALGIDAQKLAQTHGLSQDLVDRSRDWLWTAFDMWSEQGWDKEQGGFVEQLSMDGVPDLEANRRVRVQARQVFSFAAAIDMGWPEADKALALVEKGIDHIDQDLRHPDGGWVHVVKRDGTAVDNRRDLYDHAFIILAGATAYRVTGNQRALEIADEAIEFIDGRLKDHQHGGWFESLPAQLPRRSNPHMHLLEAMMAYHDATGCEKALARAAECVRLFETRFFNPANDIMAEFFANDWSPETSEDETIFEPGHHYEWATLLYQFEQKSGHDTGSWRRRLIRRADETGINPDTGLPVNALQANGNVTNSNSRLWHSLERFRAYLLHPGEAAVARKEQILKAVNDTYLDRGPKGGWIDEVERDRNPASNAVPSSMLYHLCSALGCCDA